MCGRFTLRTSLDRILFRFSLPRVSFDFHPSYNIAPTQSVFTIVPTGAGLGGTQMRWGLIPSWRKEIKSGSPIINARAETLEEKVSFRHLVNHRRCLIVADGFYEWKWKKSKRIPIYITLGEGELFAFAGLWDLWRNPAGKAISSCTIVTTEANAIIRPLHHRMPAILTRKEEKIWLSPQPFREIKKILVPRDNLGLSYYTVSTFVNSPNNNTPQCIQPLN